MAAERNRRAFQRHWRAVVLLMFAGTGMLIACAPSSVDFSEVLDASGGTLYHSGCGLTVAPGELLREHTFRAMAYPDPLRMPTETAPVLPFADEVVSYGCYWDPIEVPYSGSATSLVSVDVPTADGARWPDLGKVTGRLFADGRDAMSFLWVLHRAEPFGEWRAEAVVGDAVFAADRLGSAVRGRSDRHWTDGSVRRLGYFVVAAGLYFEPNLREVIEVPRGESIPYTLGLNGSVAGDARLRLRWTDGPWKEGPYRTLGEGAEGLQGHIPYNAAWDGLDEVTITIQAVYLGPVPRLDLALGPVLVTRPMRVRFSGPGTCLDIAVPPLNSLNLKEGPRPGAAPPVPDDPAAWLGANFLADAGFEEELVYAGGVPTGTGYWAFDQAWSAPAGQQGIVPKEGGRMLHFVSSSAFGQAPAATASEQIQLVDVSALRDRIDAGEVEVEGSAFFNRVAAGRCVSIDSGFAIRIRAYDGLPQDFPARIGSPPLAPAAVGGVAVDDDPLTWQQGSAVLSLPAGTTYIAVQIDINERVNDMAYPEYHGHYADDVRLSVRLRP